MMPYRIEYGPAIPPQYKRAEKKNPMRLQVMTAACFLLFTLLVRHFFPAGTEHLRQVLLPSAHSVTQEALDTLMGDLRNGEDFADALTAFCVYIINHDESIPH